MIDLAARPHPHPSATLPPYTTTQPPTTAITPPPPPTRSVAITTAPASSTATVTVPPTLPRTDGPPTIVLGMLGGLSLVLGAVILAARSGRGRAAIAEYRRHANERRARHRI